MNINVTSKNRAADRGISILYCFCVGTNYFTLNIFELFFCVCVFFFPDLPSVSHLHIHHHCDNVIIVAKTCNQYTVLPQTLKDDPAEQNVSPETWSGK